MKVPPPSLLEEVRLVQYDHYRQKHLNAFRNAFKAGQVTGFVLRLNLFDISYEKLAARLALISDEQQELDDNNANLNRRSSLLSTWSKDGGSDRWGGIAEIIDGVEQKQQETVAIGDPLSIMTTAAMEVVGLRQAAQRLYQRYKRDNTFTDQKSNAEQRASTPSIDGKVAAATVIGNTTNNSVAIVNKQDQNVITNDYATQLRRDKIPDEYKELIEQQSTDSPYGRKRKENLQAISKVVFNTSYLSDAIESAVQQVGCFSVHDETEKFKGSETFIMGDWEEIKSKLGALTAAHKIGAQSSNTGSDDKTSKRSGTAPRGNLNKRQDYSFYKEIDILTEETFVRNFIHRAIDLLHQVKGLKNNIHHCSRLNARKLMIMDEITRGDDSESRFSLRKNSSIRGRSRSVIIGKTSDLSMGGYGTGSPDVKQKTMNSLPVLPVFKGTPKGAGSSSQGGRRSSMSVLPTNVSTGIMSGRGKRASIGGSSSAGAKGGEVEASKASLQASASTTDSLDNSAGDQNEGIKKKRWASTMRKRSQSDMTSSDEDHESGDSDWSAGSESSYSSGSSDESANNSGDDIVHAKNALHRYKRKDRPKHPRDHPKHPSHMPTRELIVKYLESLYKCDHMFRVKHEANISSNDDASIRFNSSRQPHQQLISFLQNSLVALIHLWQARELNNHYDLPLDRYDERDVTTGFLTFFCPTAIS